MADLARSHNVALRPHFKMHKTPALALKQMEMGAVGLCCQKVGEAEVMAAAGIPNILVSNEVVAPSKLKRLVSLAPGLEWLGVCADHPEAVDALEKACAEQGVSIHVLVELDFLPPPSIPEIDEDGIPFGSGFQRCGVAQGAPLVALAQQIDSSPHLKFSGLQACKFGNHVSRMMTHHSNCDRCTCGPDYGKAQHIRDFTERTAAIDAAHEQVKQAVSDLAAVGLSCDLVSGAGTGTAAMEASTGLWNELQAGSYAFMDCDYNAILMQSGVPIGQLSAAEAQAGVTAQGSSGGASGKLEPEEGAGFQSSLFVLTEVMSLPGPGRAVCDAGLKASSVDSGLPVVAESSGMKGVTYLSASDEHGRLLISDDVVTPPRLGDKLRLIPGHCDPTVNMYDWIVGVREGVVEEVWRVAGRGMR